MDFFDKLGDFAKAAGDKTGDFIKTATDKADGMLEISRLKSKLSAARKSCDEAKQRLGAYYYEKRPSLDTLNAQERDLYSAVQDAEAEASSISALIEKAKENAPNAQPVKKGVPVIHEHILCSVCGAPLMQDAVFCNKCGSKVKEE